MTNTQCRKSHHVDWSELYPELLPLIATKLEHVSDFINFQATCKAWRSATLVTKFPWLVQTSNSPSKDLTFYRFVSKKFVKIKINRLFDDKWVCGMSYWHGYLLVVGDKLSRSVSSLVNPVTGRTIPLPHLPSSRRDNYNLLCIRLNTDGIPEYVALQASDSFDTSTFICECYIGDEEWKTVYDGNYGQFSTSIYYKSKFFLFLDLQLKIEVYADNAKDSIVQKFPAPQFPERPWHFDFCRGADELLGIVLTSFEYSRSVYFDIYCIENGKENPQWIKITNIGDDRVIFFTHRNCHMQRTNDLSEFKGNSIYFMFPIWATDKREFCRFDIENGTIEHLQCPPDVCSWFSPSLI